MRIDYFLKDAKLLPHRSVKHHDIVISDHAPLSLSLNLDNLTRSEKMWKLDPQLLKEPEFQKFLKEQIGEMNDLPETSPSILWEL